MAKQRIREFHRHVPGLLSAEECAELIAMALDPKPARVGPRGAVDESTRRSKVAWIPPNTAVVQPVLRAMRSYAADQGLALKTKRTQCQLTLYDASELGMYGRHIDSDEYTADERVVSCTVLLTDPREFTGGLLGFPDLGRMPPIMRQGDAAIFRSWLAHQVLPVWRGKRWSLVVWMS